jgi:hypothetical protein
MGRERVTAAWQRTVEQAEAERKVGKTALSDFLAEQRKRSEDEWEAATANMRAVWVQGLHADRRVTATTHHPERRSR